VCGTLGEEIGWHYGFAAAGVGMTLGLVIYLVAAPNLPEDSFIKRAPLQQPIGRAAWQSIIALLLLYAPVSLFWATYEQQGNTIALWADQFTDRRFLGGEIPVTWFQAFNPFMIFAFTPLIVAFWRWQGLREHSTVTKLAGGCLLNALAYLVMVAAAWAAGEGKADWLWLFAYFVVITVGEIYLSPTSLSLVTKVAPASLLSMMMGVWLSTSFIGGFLAGYLGTFWSSMGKGSFFLMLALLSAAAGLTIILLRRSLRAVLDD
jgi:proton-dependent oligopeptide transporter, POT family